MFVERKNYEMDNMEHCTNVAGVKHSIQYVKQRWKTPTYGGWVNTKTI